MAVKGTRNAQTADCTLENSLVEGSPIGKLYELDGYVLLLGAPHSNNTALHLAKYRADWSGKSTAQQGAAMLVGGERRWMTFDDLDMDTADFQAIGAAYERQIEYTPCRIGRATVRFLRQRPLVDFAVEYMNANRK